MVDTWDWVFGGEVIFKSDGTYRANHIAVQNRNGTWSCSDGVHFVLHGSSGNEDRHVMSEDGSNFQFIAGNKWTMPLMGLVRDEKIA